MRSTPNLARVDSSFLEAFLFVLRLALSRLESRGCMSLIGWRATSLPSWRLSDWWVAVTRAALRSEKRGCLEVDLKVGLQWAGLWAGRGGQLGVNSPIVTFFHFQLTIFRALTLPTLHAPYSSQHEGVGASKRPSSAAPSAAIGGRAGLQETIPKKLGRSNPQTDGLEEYVQKNRTCHRARAGGHKAVVGVGACPLRPLPLQHCECGTWTLPPTMMG